MLFDFQFVKWMLHVFYSLNHSNHNFYVAENYIKHDNAVMNIEYKLKLNY